MDEAQGPAAAYPSSKALSLSLPAMEAALVAALTPRQLTEMELIELTEATNAVRRAVRGMDDDSGHVLHLHRVALADSDRAVRLLRAAVTDLARCHDHGESMPCLPRCDVRRQAERVLSETDKWEGER